MLAPMTRGFDTHGLSSTALALVLAVMLAVVASPPSAQAEVVLLPAVDRAAAPDIIVTRKANFANNAEAMKEIGKARRKDDFDAVAKFAMEIADWAQVMVDYFPPETSPNVTREKTDALSTIWRNEDDFARLAQVNADAALRLADLARAGDSDALALAARELGATCGACHMSYKKK